MSCGETQNPLNHGEYQERIRPSTFSRLIPRTICKKEVINTMLYRLASIVVLGVFSAILLSGCAAYTTSPAMGTLYTETSAPAAVGEGINNIELKVGEGTVTSILGLIATGDASIRTAANAAGIRKIYYVDYKSKNILGLYATYTVFVYGE